MHRTFALLCLSSLLAAACAGRSQTTDSSARNDNVLSFNGATISLHAEGGIAALATDHVVRHDDRAFVITQRHVCSTACGAPLDSASGTLASSAADSLFSIVAAQLPVIAKDDYGTTPNAADMMSYTLRVTVEGTTRTLRADDGSMPEAMHKIVDAVRGIIDAARQ